MDSHALARGVRPNPRVHTVRPVSWPRLAVDAFRLADNILTEEPDKELHT